MTARRQLGERGLSEALDRLRTRLKESGWYLGAFSEALFWVAALKELLEPVIDYQTQDGKLLRAIGWARNYPAHELLAPLGVDLTYSGVLGAAVMGRMRLGAPGRLVWVGGSALPRQNREGDGRRELYEHLVAGRGALEPLEQGEDYLKRIPRGPKS